MRRSPFGMPETPWNWRRCADRSVGCAPFGEDLGHGGGLTDGGCGFERAEGQPCEVLSGAKKVGRFQKAEAAQARPCEDFALLSPQAMRPAQCEVHLLCSQDVGTISHGGVRPPEARGLQAKDSLQSQPKWMLQWHSGREREPRERERERVSLLRLRKSGIRIPCLLDPASRSRNVLLRAAESGTLTPEMVDKQTSGVPTPEASSSQMSPARLARKASWWNAGWVWGFWGRTAFRDARWRVMVCSGAGGCRNKTDVFVLLSMV